MNFTAWCLGSDEMNSNSVTAEVFSCENLARGRVLLDRGADRHSRKRGSDRGHY